jgi:serine/threonine protein kinase
MSLCINPDCKKTNPDDRLFCTNCGSEILLLGRYQVLRLLSEKGGFADTYEVMHHGVPRVLKVLKDSNPKAIELFKREFAVLNESNHPGIPKAEEYFEFTPRNSSTPLNCLVMEKIIGVDLEEYLEQRGRPIDERCAIDWLDQTANILKEIHERKLLHRDIKPSNIILQPEGQLVLIDFGAVGRSDVHTAPVRPTFIFTPGYAAPEQTIGRAITKSDFFSLGCTFVYLLTGQPIANMRDQAGELDWQLYAPQVSPQLGAFINRLMHPDIEQRPNNADELIQWVMANRLPSILNGGSGFYPQANQAATELSLASNKQAEPQTTQSNPLNNLTNNTPMGQVTTAPNTNQLIPLNPQPGQSHTALSGTAQVNPIAPVPNNPAVGHVSTIISMPNAAPTTPETPNQTTASSLNQQPVDRQRQKLLIGGASILGAMVLIAGLVVQKNLANNNTKDNKTVAASSGGQCSTREFVKKSGNNFGVIEIGSKGIKGAVIQELDTANEEGFKYKAREEKEGIAPRNVNASKPSAQDETVKGVSGIMKEIQDRFSIPCEQILIYGSSGLAKKAPNKEALTKEIEKATGREMKFISPEDEARFVFDGVVPEWRRNEVITIDIGSGNTKGSFLKDAQKKEYENYEVAVGTGDFSREIDKKRGSDKFVTAAEKAKKEVVIPQIREAIQRKPGILNSPRIYLAGGISWALATLTHPCDKDQTVKRKEERVAGFTKLRAEDINTFYNNTTRDRKTLFQPNLGACSPEQLVRAQKDIAKIQKDTFSENDLIAGAEILRAFSEELKFSERESIFFARYAIEALPIGYLIQQLEANKRQP